MAAEYEAVIREIVATHKDMDGAALPILHAVQESVGFVPESAVPIIADGLNLSRAEMHGIVTFYHDFRREPAGRHVMKLCRAEACQAAGGNVVAERVKRRIFAGAALLTATAVAFVGPIGFVGLIVPHALRLVLGPDNRVLVPTALVGGGLFLLVADTLARNVIAPAELSVGVITSFCGAPFFVYLLRLLRVIDKPFKVGRERTDDDVSLFLLVEFVVHAHAGEAGVAAEDVEAQAEEVEELMSDVEEQAAELADVDGGLDSTAHT